MFCTRFELLQSDSVLANKIKESHTLFRKSCQLASKSLPFLGIAANQYPLIVCQFGDHSVISASVGTLVIYLDNIFQRYAKGEVGSKLYDHQISLYSVMGRVRFQKS